MGLFLPRQRGIQAGLLRVRGQNPRAECDKKCGERFHEPPFILSGKPVLKSATISSSPLAGLSPAAVAAQCASLADLVFFDSALAGSGSISLIAAEPVEIVTGQTPADWEVLREKVRVRQLRCQAEGATRGMAAGYVEYDGFFRFGFYEAMLVYEHGEQQWTDWGGLAARLRAKERLAEKSGPDFRSSMTREDFCQRVERVREYIAAGDIYQANLAYRWAAEWCGEAWPFYEALRRCSPAPQAAFLRSAERAILSASPECFLQMSGRRIRTRPIKGTRPRRAEASADAQSASDLLGSPKELAELVMITDLERNDLGQICEYGSVEVEELLKLERFQQVFHLISTVRAILREEIDHVTALQKCFPGGSITGAPKMRAREIIAELEPIPRGLYTGAIGYFGDDGESQFSVAIRTVLLEKGQAHFHVGAGIVADSIAGQEYQETLDKAAGILLAAENFSAH